MLAETLKHVWKMLRVATAGLHIHDSLLFQKKENDGQKKKKAKYMWLEMHMRKKMVEWWWNKNV